jgi:hypothetical protein
MKLVLSTVDLSQQALQIDRAACAGTGDEELHGELSVVSCQLSVKGMSGISIAAYFKRERVNAAMSQSDKWSNNRVSRPGAITDN